MRRTRHFEARVPVEHQGSARETRGIDAIGHHRDALIREAIVVDLAQPDRSAGPADDAQRQLGDPWPELEATDNRTRAVVLDGGRTLQDVHLADRVREHDAVTPVVEALPAGPPVRKWAVALPVATRRTRVGEIIAVRPRPAGTRRVGEDDVTDGSHVRPMRTVEENAAPVDEAVAAPRTGTAQRVGVKEEKLPPSGDTTPVAVETDGDTLVRDVARLDLDGRGEEGTVVHLDPARRVGPQPGCQHDARDGQGEHAVRGDGTPAHRQASRVDRSRARRPGYGLEPGLESGTAPSILAGGA